MSLTIREVLLKWAREVIRYEAEGELDEAAVYATLGNMKDLLAYAQEFTEI